MTPRQRWYAQYRSGRLAFGLWKFLKRKCPGYDQVPSWIPSLSERPRFDSTRLLGDALYCPYAPRYFIAAERRIRHEYNMMHLSRRPRLPA